MRSYHPNWSRLPSNAIWLALLCVAGCSNQQTALTNPFLAPDRVPPPPTRTIQPGTAQPYYPGDPLPSMQSRATPSAPTVTGASGPLPAAPPASASSPATTSPNFVAANEPPVAIPSDSDDLRFALPTPPTSPPETTQPAAQAPLQIAAATPRSPVQPASYNQPAPNNDPYVAAPGFSAPVEMWRSPQVPAPSGPASPAPQVLTPATPREASPTPAYVPTPQAPPSIPVRLRVVPSPMPPEPVAPPAPRIRIPTPVAPSAPPQEFIGPYEAQQATSYAPALPPGAVVQTVQTTELPPWPQVATNQTYQAPPAAAMARPQYMAAQPATPTPVSRDGFRPRGSTP